MGRSRDSSKGEMVFRVIVDWLSEAVTSNGFPRIALMCKVIGMRFFKGEEKLGGIKVAERVGWKIADEAERPMDVLQAA